MIRSNRIQLARAIAGGLCLAGLLATDAAAQSSRLRVQPIQPHASPGQGLRVQPVPTRGWLPNQAPAARFHTQPVPPSGWLPNQLPAAPDRRLTMPVPQRGPNPVGRLFDWRPAAPTVVDPAWRPRQEAIAGQRTQWVQNCVQQRRSNPTLDCNPPQQFASPRAAARPQAVPGVIHNLRP